MSENNFGSDGDFSHEKMIRKVNTHLANELGNLCQRTLSMVYKNCEKAVPINIQPFTKEDEELLSKAQDLKQICGEAIANQSIHKYVAAIISIIWDANKYIDVMEPWVLKKTDPDRMKTVLYVVMEVLRYAALLYQPLIPESADKILDQLTVPKDKRTFHDFDVSIAQGNPISKPKGIFPRIDLDTAMS